MPLEGTDQHEVDAARRIAGRYTLLGPLGRGGMGAVWRARDEVLQREVAVKEVGMLASLPEGERESVRARVMREAQAAARMSHPGSVVVFDVLEEDGAIFIVMELVAAPTLAGLVADAGPFVPRRAAEIALQLLDVLEAAHVHGVVHRDVKPSNIMVLPSGAVKLGDFGIASVRDHPSLTRTGQVLGSPSYMAPERAQGHPPDPASDLWGLGATLYYALEGQAPFERDDALTTLVAVVNDEPRVAERAGPLAPLLGRLLSKDPAVRPAGAALRRELEAVLREPDGPPLPAGPAPVPTDGEAVLPDAPPAAGDTAELAAAAPTATTPSESAPPAPTATTPSESSASAASRVAPLQPAPPAVSRPTRRGSVVVAAALALAAVVLVLIVRSGDGPSAPQPGQPAPAAQAPSSTPTSPRSEPAATDTTRAPRGGGSRAAAEVPPDWVRYTDTATGYRIAHPPGWQVQRLDRTRTDFRDPDTGAYLRVDWTDRPGDSPEGAWEQQSASFGSRHEGYREVRIEPTTYKGFDAAIWEYTYGSGAQLHAVNLGFVTGSHGFALNFQTPERMWDQSQPLFEAFKAAFEPPA